MNKALRLIADIVSGGNAEHQWEDILAAMEMVLAEPFTPGTEKLMLAILRFGGELRLSESSEFPHSMSPEDMLKALAVQWLEKETGLIHLPELQRVEATTQAPALASVVRAAIRRASQVKQPTVELEVVAEVRSSPKHMFSISRFGAPIGQRSEKVLPRGKPKPNRAKYVDQGEYTKYEAAWALQGSDEENNAVAFDQGYTYFTDCRVRTGQSEEEAAPA
jgi:hypothetical protein